jgi:hypothetical protein
MLTTLTEHVTMEVQCRRYAASYHSLAKSSRSQSEKMLLLTSAECWLDLAERPEPGFATSSVQRRIAPRSLCSLIFNC